MLEKKEEEGSKWSSNVSFTRKVRKSIEILENFGEEKLKKEEQVYSFLIYNGWPRMLICGGFFYPFLLCEDSKNQDFYMEFILWDSFDNCV